MRIGIGLAVRQNFERNEESTTFAAVYGAVVDALLSAAGNFHERRNGLSDDPDQALKQIELQLHYDGLEIQNLDITLSVRRSLSEERLAALAKMIGKPLFLQKDQLTVKQYVLQGNPYELHVQATVLIG